MHGEFWLALAGAREEQRVSGTLEDEDGAFLLTISPGAIPPGAKLGKSHQITVTVTVTESETLTSITHNPDPANVAADRAPRTVHGMLDDGTLVTLIDAHMSNYHPGRQTFCGHQAVHGAHLTGPDPDVHEVRWALRGVQMPGWHGHTPVETQGGGIGGEIGPGDDDEPISVAFRAKDPAALRTMTDRLPSAVDALVSLWTAREAVPDRVRLRVPDGTWCSLNSAQGLIAASAGSSLLPSDQLGGWCLSPRGGAPVGVMVSRGCPCQ